MISAAAADMTRVKLPLRQAELEALSSSGLRARWREAFGRPAPPRASRDFLLRALAHRLQEQDRGGLSKAGRRRLAQLATTEGQRAAPPRPAPPRLKPGTRLVREWRGQVHQVTVLDDGFDYLGSRYSSLSEIARLITGTRWSGPLFFGLRKAGSGPRESRSER